MVNVIKTAELYIQKWLEWEYLGHMHATKIKSLRREKS